MTRDKLRPAACEENGSLDNVKAVKRQVKQQSTKWNSGNLGSGDTAPDRQGWPPFGCNRATSRRRVKPSSWPKIRRRCRPAGLATGRCAFRFTVSTKTCCVGWCHETRGFNLRTSIYLRFL